MLEATAISELPDAELSTVVATVTEELEALSRDDPLCAESVTTDFASQLVAPAAKSGSIEFGYTSFP